MTQRFLILLILASTARIMAAGTSPASSLCGEASPADLFFRAAKRMGVVGAGASGE